ncbi:MAG: aminotransferase class IV [Fuerstiella sp.]|nr:aminotransferase class IV [Fuerstiella sp.]
MAPSNGIAYQRGQYVSVSDISIPLVDPAFTKSDAVFDVVSVRDRRFFRLDDHIARFLESSRYVRMVPPCSEDRIKQIAAQCVDRAGFTDACVYFLCLRGRFPPGAAIADPRTCEQEFIAYSIPWYTTVPAECAQTGAHLFIAQTRRAPSAAINQRCKNFNRMDLTRAQFEALDAGAHQPVLLSVDGFLTEGPGFNCWLVRDGKLFTPRDDILEGITRRTVFDLCRMAELDAEAAPLLPEDLLNADEAFLSSTAGGIFPVTQVNGQPVGDGIPGQITCRLRDFYWDKRAEGWHGTSVADLTAAPEPTPG